MKGWILLLVLSLWAQILTPLSSLAESYFPLAVGNEWRYLYYYDGEYRYSVLNKVKGMETMKDGAEVYAMFTYSPVLNEDVTYYCDTGDAIYVYQTEDDKPSLFLQFPLGPNRSWISTDLINSVPYEVVGNEEITVPAGTFETWKVEVHDVIFHRFIYFALGVGQVRVIYDNGAVYELKEYKVVDGG